MNRRRLARVEVAVEESAEGADGLDLGLDYRRLRADERERWDRLMALCTGGDGEFDGDKFDGLTVGQRAPALSLVYRMADRSGREELRAMFPQFAEHLKAKVGV